MKKIIILLSLVIFGVSSISAQSIAIGPQLGYVKVKDADEPTYMLGAAIRLKFAGFLGVEVNGAYKKEEYIDGAVKVHTYPIMATALLHFISPLYAAAGIGWYNTKVEFSKDLQALGAKDVTDSQVGYHVGAGIELPLGRLILTGDLKYIFLNLDLGNLPNLKNLKNDYMVISVGALISLSK